MPRRPNDFPSSAVAIIGMAGRFPDAPDLHTFWHNLTNGVESLTPLTDDELLAVGVPPEQVADPHYVKKCTYLEGADRFDASFFGFNAREAEILDPQQRVFLECAWEAVEDAGYVCDQYPGAVSVFAGLSINTYLLANLLANPAVLETVGGYQTMIANDKDFLATRVSYKLNLRGPAMTVQTACSTSLVAVQLGWQSLLNHQCDLALVGGVSVGFPQKIGYLYSEGMIFSPDGHCRPFDENGQGIRGGSGAGVVVLKRLQDAIADRDPIRAVVLSAAINNDGADKMGYTAPSMDGQAEVIAMAQARAGVDPGTITYIEAHGTATPLGDPIEVGALSQVFRSGTTRREFCALGSVKSNIGHLDAAAGIAGLTKTVLSLEHRMLPPTLNFERPNPQIDFRDSPFYVNDTLAPWDADGQPLRAGVSSFGIGGTNAHVILEEAPERDASIVGRPAQLFVLSARSATALDAAASNLAAHLTARVDDVAIQGNGSAAHAVGVAGESSDTVADMITPASAHVEHADLAFADAAYTLQVGRKRFEHRRAVVARNRAEAIAALTRPDRTKLSGGEHTDRPPVAFLFSGQGSQYAGMGRELYDAEPTFREELDRCAERLLPHLGRDIRELILTPVADGAASELNQTQFAQPALFAFEYALARTLMSWGVRPAAMIGHSIGEYVAACLSGVLSLDDSLRLVAERGRLMQEMPAGRMLAIPLSQSEVTPLLDDDVVLAAVNAPRLCVVAGPTDAVTNLERRLTAQGIECRGLHTSHAFHSAMMDPMLPSFLETLRGLTFGTPEIPYLSNLTGTWAHAEEITQPEYWANHLRNTVRFADGIRELVKTPHMVLLEVGPGKTLATLARQTAGYVGHEIVHSIPHPLDDHTDFDVVFRALGQLWVAGVEIAWEHVHRNEQLHRVSLPTYPFERQRYLVEPKRDELPTQSTAFLKKHDIAEWFYAPSWQRVPSLVDTGAILPPSDGSAWLIFLDDDNVGVRMAERLSQAGHSCLTIRRDAVYKASGDEYTIRPGQREDYDRVVADVISRGVQLGRVVHLWSVTDQQIVTDQQRANLEQQERELNSALDNGFFSLIYLMQALADASSLDSLVLTVVTTDLQRVLGYEPLVPVKSLVLGPCKMIEHEFPTVRCQSIDIELGSVTDELIDALVLDATLGSEYGSFAYRAGHRWSETFVSMPISAARTETPSRLRERGVYLITGGLGGLGQVVAKFLAETVHARLVLTGRSGLPPRAEWSHWIASHDAGNATSQRIQAVQELESLGAEVMVGYADVSDYDAMAQVVASAREQFGAIHGVFHVAGLPGGAMIQVQSREDALHVLASKVNGTLVLDALFEESDLDFLVLFSSINTIVGFIGTTDYTAANIFLDHYAAATSSPTRPVLAINWDTWQEVGMAVASAAIVLPKHSRAAALEHGITTQEGRDALRRVLDVSVPQVAVVTRDLQRLVERSRQINAQQMKTGLRHGEQAAQTSLSQHARPQLAQDLVEPRNDEEQFIAGLWRELLGIAQVGIDDNFFELGGHSLIATGLLSRIQKEWQVKLPLRTIFEAPTVRELAERIEALSWAAQPAAAIASEESREQFEI